ncbi:class I glutamine amidotransferase-like protein [Pterulicium gracile]|uniref:catalase n=1 Tax=Pterulicium gracile TaxID=1884261 RepID=A0A5C3R1T4_9AGAR|nr:class I glutamine amidotransferase-like protein [Pterula gracilis]
MAQNVGGAIPSPATNIKYHDERASLLSQAEFPAKIPTIKGRRVAIIIRDGFDATFVNAVKTALTAAGVVPMVIGPRRRPGKSSAGGEEQPDHHFEAQRSTMFDAFIIAPGTEEQAQSLASSGRVIHWIREAFAHCKVIAALGPSISVLQAALGSLPNVTFASDQSSTDVVNSLGVITAGQYGAAGAKVDFASVASESKGFAGQFDYSMSRHRWYERETQGLTKQVAF